MYPFTNMSKSVLIGIVASTVLFGQCFMVTSSSTHMKVKISNITYRFDQNLVNISMNVENNVLNCLVNITTAIRQASVQVDFNVKSMDRPDTEFQNFFSKTINLCDVINRAFVVDPLIAAVYALMVNDKKNKIFTKCPIEKVNIFHYVNIYLYLF